MNMELFTVFFDISTKNKGGQGFRLRGFHCHVSIIDRTEVLEEFDTGDLWY
jgi:hypothetical protein